MCIRWRDEDKGRVREGGRIHLIMTEWPRQSPSASIKEVRQNASRHLILNTCDLWTGNKDALIRSLLWLAACVLHFRFTRAATTDHSFICWCPLDGTSSLPFVILIFCLTIIIQIVVRKQCCCHFKTYSSFYVYAPSKQIPHVWSYSVINLILKCPSASKSKGMS